MKATFLGTVYTKTNKDHVCYTCWKTITPDFLHKTRHDVWKEGQAVVNKYYCATCDNLLKNQPMLMQEDWKPYNPEYWEFTKRFPHIFNPFFAKKYDIDKRVAVIGDLQMLFGLWFFAKIQYCIAHKIFWLKSFNGYKYRFDNADLEEYAKTHEKTKTHAYFLFDNF